MTHCILQGSRPEPMKNLPSRFRRLDGALADLPLEEPMLLTELDGFLTALVVGPDTIPQSEWLQSIWGSDDSVDPPFDDPADVQWFVDAVMARYAEIVRDLTRGKPQPIFDTDDRNGSGKPGSMVSPKRWRSGRKAGRRWVTASIPIPSTPWRRSWR